MVTLDARLARLTPERRAKIEARTDDLHREYLALRKLREHLHLTQEDMAERLGVKQPAISKLENGERRLTLDALSSIIAAQGGEWELLVTLPGTPPLRLTGSEEFPMQDRQPQPLNPHTTPSKSFKKAASTPAQKKRRRTAADKSK